LHSTKEDTGRGYQLQNFHQNFTTKSLSKILLLISKLFESILELSFRKIYLCHFYKILKCLTDLLRLSLPLELGLPLVGDRVLHLDREELGLPFFLSPHSRFALKSWMAWLPEFLPCAPLGIWGIWLCLVTDWLRCDAKLVYPEWRWVWSYENPDVVLVSEWWRSYHPPIHPSIFHKLGTVPYW